MTIDKTISRVIGQVLWPELIWLDTPEEQEALIEERETQIKSILTALEAKGLVIAPVEPTERMLDAGDWSYVGHRARMAGIYRAMIEARGDQS